MTDDWSVVGSAPAQVQNPWAVRAVAPVPTTAGDVVKGVGDAALSGASRVAGGIVAAPVALANRFIAALSGGDPQMAAEAAHDYVSSHFVHDATTPVGKQIGGAVSSALAPVGESAQFYKQLAEQAGQKLGLNPGTVSNQLDEAGDILGTAGLAAPVLAGARASTEAATLAAQNTPAWAKRGFVSAADHPVAAGAAGPSGTQALTLQNQQVGNTALGAEAGVPHGTVLTHDTIEAGRAASDAVKGRVAAALPTAHLSPSAANMVNSVGADDLVTRTPDAQAIIDTQKQRLLAGPLTGPQVVNNTRALRQEGYARLGSEDVEQQAVGKAQIAMSRALEQHIEDTLQPNADVSMDQWKQARVAQAKSSALQAALKGQNVDLAAIGRMQRADPGYLTGAFKDAADFANEHPKVSGLANNIEVPPSFGSDFGQAIRSGGMPQDILGRLFGASGVSAGARRVLTGSPADALGAARQTPVAGLGGEFSPLEPQPPQPPPGMTASSPSAPPVAPAGPPGQIPLADLLSYGVEQPSPQGLSSASMGSPAQSGIPFARNAEHEAGELSLADAWASPTDMSLSPAERAAGRERTGGDAQSEPEIIPRGAAEREGEAARRNSQEVRTYGGQPANQDLAEVMSSNVPDNIIAKSPPASAPDFENLGQPLVSHEARPDGTHVFSSPNGTTTAVRLPDGSLKITGSTTSKAARGTGEGTARIEAAADFAHKSGDPVVSDNEVSGPEQKVYDSLKRKGLDVRVNPHATDRGTGVKKSASELKGVYEIHPPLGFSLQ